jgi:hypothetical protein
MRRGMRVARDDICITFAGLNRRPALLVDRFLVAVSFEAETKGTRMRSSLFAAAAFSVAICAVTSAVAQVNQFERMVGRWVLLTPEPGTTTPAGHQVIITTDGSVFTSSNTIKGAIGRCTHAGANFCLEGTDGANRRFMCPYQVSFLRGNEALNLRLTRESDVVPCPSGIFNRTD